MKLTASLKSLLDIRIIPQFTAAVTASLSTFSVGEIKAWTSSALPILQSNSTTLEEPITSEEGSWLVCIIHLSAFFACPFYGFVLENLGRKMTGCLSVIPLLIGWMFIMFAESITSLYIGRLFQGLCLSGANIFASIYISEISEDNIRGALGCLRGVFYMIGILFMYSMKSHLSLTIMGFFSLIIPAFLLLLLFWLPESPMFLMTKGLSEEALNSYIWLRDGDLNKAEEEMKKLSMIVQSNNKKMTLKEVIAVRGTRNALFIVFVLAVLTQLSGGNIVLMYTSTLFEMSGSSVTPYTSTIIVGVILILGSVSSFFLTDSFGRRPLLIYTWMFQSVSLTVLGVYLYTRELGYDVSAWGVFPVLCLSVFCFCYVAGPGNLIYVIAAETFRPEARNLAANVNCVNWLIAFLSTKLHHNFEEAIGLYGCYWIYAGVCITGALFTYFKLPETRNRSLESILKELNCESAIEDTCKIKR